MKKLFTLVVIALLTIAFSSTVMLADASPVPAEAQSALKAALADPPVSLDFLVDVVANEDVAAYLRYAPIVVKLGFDLEIYLSSQSEYPVYVQLVDSCGASVVIGSDQVHLDCEGDNDLLSCCTEIESALRQERQSDFWKALTSALQTGKK